MSQIKTQFQPASEGLTTEQAKKEIQSLNLINGFLFDSVLENEEDAKIVVGYILSTTYNKKVQVKSVSSQKVFQAIDTKYHSIRLDAYVKVSDDNKALQATIYDIEMEDRESDRPDLPKRLRYYGALHDTKFLDSSTNYRTLPEFVSITISSYDPFGVGDMYYEAGSQLKTHPNIEYDDGITHIFLYCKGKPNLKDISHSKKMSEMLKYILSGEKPSTPNKDIDNVDEIVTKIKALPEVTSNYMKQWDREQTLQREAFDKGEKNTNDIYSWLFDQGRGDDVAIATKNPAYYSKLSAEYEEWKNNNS